MAITAADVKLIFTTSLTDAAIDAFIAAAAIIVGPDGCDLAAKGVAASTIDEIQKWLAAHFASVNDPRVVSFRSSGHSTTFESKIGLALNASKYGQQVRMLDKTGCVSKLGDPDRKGPMRWRAGAAFQLEPTFDERSI